MRRSPVMMPLLLASCSHGAAQPQLELIAPCRGLERADIPEATEQIDERDHIAFPPDSRLLLGDAHAILASRAAWLKGRPGHGLLVRGLTGHEAGASELSLARRRVDRVAAFLLRQGVPGMSVRRETVMLADHPAIGFHPANSGQPGVMVQARSC